jgi:hypothetical protein
MNLAPTAPLLLAAALATPAVAQVDDFENGTNPNGWSFGVTTPDVIESTGGNPGGWLHNPLIDSFAPILTIDPASTSLFVGDLRANGVTRIGLDAITNSATFGAAGREMSILLRDTKGTFDVSDDDYAYFVGPLVPQVGAGWSSYSFDIPSQSTAAVPAGWKGGWVGDPENFRPGVEWSDVITNVDVVEFWWLNPSFFAIFQQWDVGVDNIFVEAGGPGTSYCTPAVANSTGQPGVISAAGSDVASNNDLTLTATSLPLNAFGFFLTSQTQDLVPNPGGSMGNLCLGGAIGRYVGPGQVLNTGTAGEFALVLDLTQTPTPTGLVPVAAGETWNFQAWHRDAVGGQATSNLTDAISITFR